MTAKEYCEANPPKASCNLFSDEIVFLHGIDYGVDDAVYISDTYGTTTTYHRLRIRYDATGSPYLHFKNVRLHLDRFIKLDNEFVTVKDGKIYI